MQNTSALYNSIFASEHTTEYKVVIGSSNTTYDMSYITGLSTTHQVFDDGNPSIGNAISAQIDLSLREFITEPEKMAIIKPYVRLKNQNGTVSEWLQKGVFYIDTRKKDYSTGEITIHGYDALLRGDKDIYTNDASYEEWPKSDIDCVTYLASTFLDAELDSRTISLMTREYEIPFPGYGDDAIQARSLLAYIAGMYGGNFVMSDTGQLRLIVLNNIPVR